MKSYIDKNGEIICLKYRVVLTCCWGATQVGEYLYDHYPKAKDIKYLIDITQNDHLGRPEFDRREFFMTAYRNCISIADDGVRRKEHGYEKHCESGNHRYAGTSYYIDIFELR